MDICLASANEYTVVVQGPRCVENVKEFYTHFYTHFPTTHLDWFTKEPSNCIKLKSFDSHTIKKLNSHWPYNLRAEPKPIFPVDRFLPTLAFLFLVCFTIACRESKVATWNKSLGQNCSADFYKEPEAVAYTSIILCCTQREASVLIFPQRAPKLFTKTSCPP